MSPLFERESRKNISRKILLQHRCKESNRQKFVVHHVEIQQFKWQYAKENNKVSIHQLVKLSRDL